MRTGSNIHMINKTICAITPSICLLLACASPSFDESRPVFEYQRDYLTQTGQILDTLRVWGIEDSSFIVIVVNNYFCSSCIHPKLGEGISEILAETSFNSYVVTTNAKMREVLQPHISFNCLIYKKSNFLDSIDYPIYDWTILAFQNGKLLHSTPTKSLLEAKMVLDTIKI